MAFKTCRGVVLAGPAVVLSLVLGAVSAQEQDQPLAQFSSSVQLVEVYASGAALPARNAPLAIANTRVVTIDPVTLEQRFVQSNGTSPALNAWRARTSVPGRLTRSSIRWVRPSRSASAASKPTR